METSSEDEMAAAGLTNRERYYAWRTENAVKAWHRRDFDACQNTALELLMVPLLPLWHRCNLNYYLAGVARHKNQPPQLCQTYLRETLHYIKVLQQIDIDGGEPEDEAFVILKRSAEDFMIELEADILSLENKPKAYDTTLLDIINAHEDEFMRNSDIEMETQKSSDKPSGTSIPDQEHPPNESFIELDTQLNRRINAFVNTERTFPNEYLDTEMASQSSQGQLLSRQDSPILSTQQNTRQNTPEPTSSLPKDT